MCIRDRFFIDLEWKKFANQTYIAYLMPKAYSCIKGRRPPETQNCTPIWSYQRKETNMSKKKKNDIDSVFDALIWQCMLGNGGIRNKAMDSVKDLDYTQQVEQDEKFYEQEDWFQSMNVAVRLARIMKNDHQDLKEAQKYIKKLWHLTDVHDSFDHDMKKGQKKHAKQINKLNKKVDRQQLELKKYRKQIKEQKKMLRTLAVYLDLGTMSDDLSKIQKNCCKEINMQRNNTEYSFKKSPPVIDAKFREV